MPAFRPIFAAHPMHFGRGPVRRAYEPARQATKIANDLKLFGATFFAGFLFVSILIG